MKTKLEQIKDKYAEEKGYHDYDYYLLRCPVTSVNSVDEIAKRYALECCKATKSRIAHEMGVTFDATHEEIRTILNEDNIVLL